MKAKEIGRVKTGVPVLKQTLIAFGETILDVDGGVKQLNITDVIESDIVIVTLKSDDTGYAITTPLIAEALNGAIKITRADDVSSNDDAVAVYQVLRQSK